MAPRNINKRLRWLLKEGFFPAQVPPCFNTEKYSDLALEAIPNWVIDTKHKEYAYEKYSAPRVGHNRRPLAITNPIPQIKLSKIICENWKEINKHFAKSKISVSRPSFSSTPGRSIKITPTHQLPDKKLIHSRGARYVLISDISHFFPTIYTHSIPWALHGKSIAKRNRSPSLFGNKLDAAVSECQRNQTAGIPIGPDTSHIISEIVGTSVDIFLREKLGKWPSGLRYVDDFYLFFEDYSEAVLALNKLNNSLSEFELKMNGSKTKIIPCEKLMEDAWTHSFSDYELSPDRIKQRRQITRYFDMAFSMAEREPEQNVMQFAIRKMQSEIIKKDNWPVFEAFLLRSALAYPNTIQDVALIADTYLRYGYPLQISPRGWRGVINNIICEHASAKHESEVSWALWLAARMGVQINGDAVRAIEQSNLGSVPILLSLHLESIGKLKKRIDRNQLPEHSTFNSEHWLLCYEGSVQGWINHLDPNTKTQSGFSWLESKNIKFFDINRLPEPIFVWKENTSLSDDDKNRILDSDEDLLEYFDFPELSDSYLNSRAYSSRHSDPDEDEDEDEEMPWDLGDDIPY